MSNKSQDRFDKFQDNASFEVKADCVVQGKFVSKANSRTEISSTYRSQIGDGSDHSEKAEDSNHPKKVWKLNSDISQYPAFESEQILVDALYNLSLEELDLNIEADETFRTGEKWEGVWTRDISYSILLGLGILEPEVSKNSLRRKVKAGSIVQDTGTGGAYPVSSDRVVWALAAYEIYQVTADHNWLEEIYPIIKRSLSDDLKNVYDSTTGLVKGESSFLDWREQSYPEWMQPADIHESLALGTNAVHFQANIILAKIAGELGENLIATAHLEIAKKIKEGINQHLWLSDKGYFGQYVYGRNHKIVSPKAEALGEALCVIFDIADADKQSEVVSQTPVSHFGIPSIFPQITRIPSYHNDGIWPFVQAFWSLAAAKVQNELALTESLDALYRAAALFLTNKENFVAHAGDCEGTQINSDRQLWSVAGNLGMVYKVFFGLSFENNHLTFHPFVPQKYAGNKKLKGLGIRKAIFDLEIDGFGNQIEEISLDGKSLDKPLIPLNLEGSHYVKIKMSNTVNSENNINKQVVRFAPATPKVKLKNNFLIWDKQEDAESYKVLKNGQVFNLTTNTQIPIKTESYASYQVIAVNANGDESFASEPQSVVASDKIYNFDMSEFSGPALWDKEGYQGEGYIEISKSVNTAVNFNIDIKEAGQYAVDFMYSNGNGPVNTDNRCAIRALYLENQFVGSFVFPQRGTGLWKEWGRSNSIQMQLKKGNNNFKLSFEHFCENMNGEINQALLSQVRLIKIN